MRNKRLKKMVLKNFTNLEKAAKKIGKSWDKNTLPLITIDEMINTIYFKTDEKDLQKFKTDYNNVLDTLKKTLKNKAKEMRTKSISIEYLSIAINIIKDGFAKGLNG